MAVVRRDGWLARWWPWLAMGVIVVVTLALASGSDRPRTNAERIDAIAETVKCPTCKGESVLTSQALAAQDIRDEIARQVRAGRTDDQVRAFIAERIGGQYLLTPSAGGLGGLTWALPVVVLVVGFGALAFAFAKWRRELATPPDDDDRALVAQAMAEEQARAGDGGLDDGRIGEGAGR
jgi:cytochrome c-type biogenesis protein CcmH